MGVTKNNLFTDSQNRIAALAKALGHPARIAILERLLVDNACICGDLVDVLPLSQSTISQHLKALKEAGIITGEIEGVKTCYCINPNVWEEAQIIFVNLFQKHQCCTPKT
ncbi:MAG: transcriptional regulator [Saprospiraceae bacterium]|nr:MAG: transcriptional regulator [Saprospiraceae bacterium]